jgi:putative hemolysin
MSKYLVVAVLLALAGCQSVGGDQAVQLDKRKFEISYSGPEGAGVHAAQDFCVTRGFSHAFVFQFARNKVAFYCTRDGEVPRELRSSKGRIICMDAANGAKVCGRFQ